ncbi:MAG: hypothetical protein A3E01_00175 [Gammaproteobacteria bacterium RIFCSPHIGHO2_12_FULL_63_22]|nr:MAG: hypothetical protein A3E01_00175 [Gammaproteobacteria bacterium RIFCSPHIGHO2_12_FULL_63_22]
MSRNGSGVYTPPGASFPAVAETLIEAAKFNTTINDVADALTGSVSADGQTTITGNQAMATYRHTGVGNAVNRTDYAATGQVQDSSFQWGGTAGGTADALTLTLTPAITAYAAGQTFRFKAGAAANTGATTLAVSALATKAIQLRGAALAAGDIQASLWYEVTYDGAAFQLTPLGALPRSILVATAGGTVDAITATFSPAIALADQTLVAVVCAGANTSTAPTFAPNGLTARTITRGGGQVLLAGSIPAAGFVALLEYNLANTRWELLNPYPPPSGLTTTVVSGTTQTASTGTRYLLSNVAATAVTAPTAADGAEFEVVPVNGLFTNTLDFGSDTVRGPNGTATGVITLNLGAPLHVIYSSTLSKWVML